jgi:Bacteriodetes cell division protein (FtsL-like)
MAENKLKNPVDLSQVSVPVVKRKRSGGLFGNNNFNAVWLFDNIYFIFYMGFLGVIYIANSHYAVKTVKEIKTIQSELQKTSWESNSRKADLMFESMESRVSLKVEHLGLKKLNEPPKKIIITKE